VTAASGVILRSDAIAAFECESEEVIERHRRAIVIGRIRNVFKIGGSGALVYWRGAYNSIGWTDDEVRRAVGLFPRQADFDRASHPAGSRERVARGPSRLMSRAAPLDRPLLTYKLGRLSPG